MIKFFFTEFEADMEEKLSTIKDEDFIDLKISGVTSGDGSSFGGNYGFLLTYKEAPDQEELEREKDITEAYNKVESELLKTERKRENTSTNSLRGRELSNEMILYESGLEYALSIMWEYLPDADE